MSSIIGWATGVNKKVLDSTSITVGDKAYVEDSGDTSSFSERRLTSLYSPDSYNVVMEFDWLTKDENGKSELDRFVDWYKYRHKRGVNPFEFPAISNFNILGSIKTCYYRITSSLSMQKSGYCMKVTMTWQEYYSGVIEVPDVDVSVNSVEIYVGDSQCKAHITFSQSFDTEPTEGSYPLFISSTPVTGTTELSYIMADTTITSSYGNYINYTFTKPSTTGTYYAYIATKNDSSKSDDEEFSLDELTILSQEYGYTFEV